jgi:hypothetical protein
MLHKRTVFILGAGASCEAGLPDGKTLRNLARGRLDIRYQKESGRFGGDDVIFEAFRREASRRAGGFQGDVNRFLAAGWRLRDALPQSLSIDNLLDAHRDDQLLVRCGKLTIARCILAAESASTLRIRIGRR